MGGNSGAYYDETVGEEVGTVSAMGSVVEPGVEGAQHKSCRITIPKVTDWEIRNVLPPAKSEDGMEIDEDEEAEKLPLEILIGSEGS